MPGGIDPHTHLEMPFMGTTAAETWESGTFAALSGGTTLVVDFVIPGPDGMLAALDDWEAKAKRQASSDYSLPYVRQRLVEEAFRRDGEGDRPRHQHLQAFHGLQGRADGERRRDVRLVPALRRTRRAAAGACRERRHRRRPAGKIHEGGPVAAPRRMPIRVRRKSRARRPTAPS